MLDQSFSYNNFRIIFEVENRKARFNTSFLDNKYVEAAEDASALKKEIRKLKNEFADDTSIEELETQLLKAETERDIILENFLFYISQHVNQRDFSLRLNQFFDNNTWKQIYTIDKTPATFFVMKQLQYNLRKTFNISHSERHLIVKQFKDILTDDFPKYIVRTDIKSFYESVSQEKLMWILTKNSLLSPQSLKILRNLFYEYNKLTGQLNSDNKKGIPRGVGVSAYLAELYMRDIDENIRRLEGVRYYARYVDDIIVVFTPTSKSHVPEAFLSSVEAIIVGEKLKVNKKLDDGYVYRYLKTIEKESDENKKFFAIAKLINKEKGELAPPYFAAIEKQIYSVFLPLNKRLREIESILNLEKQNIENNKTFQCDLFENKTNTVITFLGYKFIIKDGICTTVLLSDNKMRKYAERITLVLQSFIATRKYNYLNARKMLHYRLAYLTRNTKLTKPKKGFIGIFYANSLINPDCQSLVELDEILGTKIDEYLNPLTDRVLMTRLKRFSFADGFKNKTFYNLSTKKMPKMKDAEGNVLRSNFEKIVNIWK